MTGFVVGDATSQLQKELNETKDSLNECVTELVQCATNTTECLTELNSTSQDLAETEETLLACETTLEKREEDIQVLTNVLKQCNVEVTTLQTDYEELMQNSVKYVCCSVADVDNSVTKHWDMVGNKIVCNDGNRAIDCKTGELS
jgi:chromosome segregation ATPase